MRAGNQCPVCQARFRGARVCSRCGADLEPLMRLATRAWQLRQASRGALATGDIEIAIEFAEQAEALQSTSAGAALRTMCAWLRRDTADAQHG